MRFKMAWGISWSGIDASIIVNFHQQQLCRSSNIGKTVSLTEIDENLALTVRHYPTCFDLPKLRFDGLIESVDVI